MTQEVERVERDALRAEAEVPEWVKVEVEAVGEGSREATNRRRASTSL